MNKEQQYCITAIIITLIWAFSQSIIINVGGEGINIPYLNLDNSTIKGQISIEMPIFSVIPTIILEATQNNNFMILILSIILLYAVSQIKKKGRDYGIQNNTTGTEQTHK